MNPTEEMFMNVLLLSLGHCPKQWLKRMVIGWQQWLKRMAIGWQQWLV